MPHLNNTSFRFVLPLVLTAIVWSTVAVVSPVFAGRNDGPAKQYTPKSEEVVQALDKLCNYLLKNYKNEDRAGGVALAALAHYKYTGDYNNQLYLDALKGIREQGDKMDIYATGISMIMLIETDPKGNRQLIDGLMQSLLRRQKPHGGWGYPDGSHALSGDTSMTQYVVLSYWTALNSGVPINMESAERVCDWLLKTQDPSGCYGYQGKIAESYAKPVAQTETGLCMAAAGLGSTYIIADVLNIGKLAPAEEGLPDALKPVEQKLNVRNYRSRTPPVSVMTVKKRGNAWFDKNFSARYPAWPFYYYYALERYQSFRESIDNINDPSPAWYNTTVEAVLDKMNSDGGVNGGSCGPIPAAAYAALFLMRSTKKSIEKVKYFGPGELIGGKGFPKNMNSVTLRNGQVVAKKTPTTSEELLAALSDPDNTELEMAVDSLDEMPPELAKAIMSETGQKIKELVSDPVAERRLAAVKAIGKSADLDNTPVLLYALTDPDPGVVMAARDALCRIARKINGGYGPDEGFDEHQRDVAINKWKEWYLAIRPNAVLE